MCLAHCRFHANAERSRRYRHSLHQPSSSEAVRRGAFPLLLGRLGLLHHRGQVLAIRMRLLDSRVHIEMIERLRTELLSDRLNF